MTPLDWFKKEKPLLGLLGSGGGASIGAATFEPITVRYILIGGGGAGGPAQGGGGGGGGAVRYAQLEIEGGVDHPYQVGGGGAVIPYVPAQTIPNNIDGDQSWFTSPTITAGFGGGGGAQGIHPTSGLDEDHGRVGGDLGGNGGGGGIKDYTAASPGGPSTPVTGHPEINHPQGSRYGGGNGFAGPGGGSGNRGGGGGGSALDGYPAGHNGPVNGGPTQNPGTRYTGGEGAPGFEMPSTYIPNAAQQQFVSLQPTAYGYNGYATSIPSPQNMLGMREPTVPSTYRNYFGAGGGGGAEREKGGNGGAGPDFATNGNYGGGGNGAGANGYNLPETGSKGAPGLNGRGGGGGGGGPDSTYAGGGPSATPNVGHAGGSGILIIQYPKARTAVASQPTYTNIITSTPAPEGYDYFVAIGPAGASKGFGFPHPGEGNIKFE